MQLPGCQVWAGTRQWPASRSTSCRLSSSSFCHSSCRSCSATALTTSTTHSQATPSILCTVYTGDCCSHREHLFTFERKGEDCRLQYLFLVGNHGHGKKIARPSMFIVCTKMAMFQSSYNCARHFFLDDRSTLPPTATQKIPMTYST